MNKRIAAAVALLALGGCSTMGGGQVQQIGRDSYTVRTLSTKSVSEAKQQALVLANRHCKSEKHAVMLVDEMAGVEDTGEKYYDVTFMCLAGEDADFIRIKHRQLNNISPTEAE